MEKELSAIFGKPSDYKICKGCGAINFYEHEECHNCNKNNFHKEGLGISKYIDNEYEFYKKEGYTEQEIDNIKTEV